MGFLLTLVLGILLGVLSNEIFAWMDPAARWLAQNAAAQCPDQHRARMAEEWLADLDTIPTPVSKVAVALTYYWAAWVIAVQNRAPAASHDRLHLNSIEIGPGNIVIRDTVLAFLHDGRKTPDGQRLFNELVEFFQAIRHEPVLVIGKLTGGQITISKCGCIIRIAVVDRPNRKIFRVTEITRYLAPQR